MKNARFQLEIRREGNDSLKNLLKKEISEDEEKKNEKEIQVITEQVYKIN